MYLVVTKPTGIPWTPPSVHSPNLRSSRPGLRQQLIQWRLRPRCKVVCAYRPRSAERPAESRECNATSNLSCLSPYHPHRMDLYACLTRLDQFQRVKHFPASCGGNWERRADSHSRECNRGRCRPSGVRGGHNIASCHSKLGSGSFCQIRWPSPLLVGQGTGDAARSRGRDGVRAAWVAGVSSHSSPMRCQLPRSPSAKRGEKVWRTFDRLQLIISVLSAATKQVVGSWRHRS